MKNTAIENRALVYIHGKGGNAGEAAYFRPLFSEYDVLGFDYRSEEPWDAVPEYREYFDSLAVEYSSITVIASSLGAYFLMISGAADHIGKAFFVSPIVDMERLIRDMMFRANVSEEELRQKGRIVVSPEEILSWEYLDWVIKHPIKWDVQTFILYGEKDNFQSIETMRRFAGSIEAELTVMPGGEHWFHTDEQNEFRWNWLDERR